MVVVMIIKKFFSFMVVPVFLTACGGGSDSGSASSANSAYTGKRELAALSVANQAIFDEALTVSSVGILSGTVYLEKSSSHAMLGGVTRLQQRYDSLDKILDRYVDSSRYQARNVDLNEACTNGGSISVSGSLSDTTNTGTLNLNSNQCNEDGVITNGVGSLIVHSFDTNMQQITDFTLTTNSSFTYDGVTYTETGEQRFTYNPYSDYLTAVSNLTRKSASQQFLDNNLMLVVNDLGMSLSGQLCEGSNGCVNLSTPQPLNSSGTAGEVILTGAGNSKIRYYFVGTASWVGVDMNGDGVYETTSPY